MAALVLLLMLVLGLTNPTPARANDPIADCLAEDKIWVAVYDQGEPIAAACTSGQTGFERLREFTEVQTAGQGFICQIDARPEACAVPTGDGPYWVYWWWREDAWVYATTGGSYRGQPGSIEAWNYSAGEQPPAPAADQPAPASSSQTRAQPTETADSGGLPGWVPTVATLGVIALVGSGYLIWQRRKAG